MTNVKIGNKFQWAKGEKIGTVETIESETSEYFIFESGGRIFKDLIIEYMIDITESGPIIDEQDELTPQRTIKTDQININKPKDEDSPLMSLFKSLEKTKSHKLNISIDVDIPSGDLYKILINSFGEKYVEEVLIQFVKNQISKEILNTSVDKSIFDIINSYKSTDHYII